MLKTSFYYRVIYLTLIMFSLNHASDLKEFIISSPQGVSIKKPCDYEKNFTAEDLNIKVKRFQGKYYETATGMKSIPILSDDSEALLFFKYYNDATFLPKLYLALTDLTGESDDYFDSFKGSFSFQFLLNVEKNNNQSQFLYWIMQYRSFIRIKLYQIVSKTDPRDDRVFTKTNPSLFSERDMANFSFSFVENLLNNFETKKDISPKPFVLSSYSDALVFGYLKGKYFSEKVDYNNISEEIGKFVELVEKETDTYESEKATDESEKATEQDDPSVSNKRKKKESTLSPKKKEKIEDELC